MLGENSYREGGRQSSIKEGRPSGPIVLAFTMAVGADVQPSPSLEENGSKGSSSLGKGEGQKVAKDESSGSREGLVKGPRKPGQCLPKSSEISEMTIKSEGLASHIQHMK